MSCSAGTAKLVDTQQKIAGGIPDSRPLLKTINPDLPHHGFNNVMITSLIAMLNSASGWELLTGNTNGDCWYYPQLKENPQLHDAVQTSWSWYVEQIQQKYPDLKHIKFGIIKLGPKAKSQYSGHSERLTVIIPPTSVQDIHIYGQYHLFFR